MKQPARFANLLALVLSLLALSACGEGFRDALFNIKKEPDPFSVIPRPALIIPPEFSLLPPKPVGSNEVGRDRQRNTAEKILLGAQAVEPQTPSEQLILKAARADGAHDHIRLILWEEWDEAHAPPPPKLPWYYFWKYPEQPKPKKLAPLPSARPEGGNQSS